MKFEITKKFTSGLLTGMTITETTNVGGWVIGKEYKGCAGSSSYVILNCVEIA